MATFTFACAACGAQVVCDSARQKYCNECKYEVRKARMRNYYHAGLRGTVIGSESKCASCDAVFKRLSSSQKFCPPCGREKRRLDTVNWKEKVGYSHQNPNAKIRIGSMVVCGGCAITFRKRVTYEKYCDKCKPVSDLIRYRSPVRKIKASMSSRLCSAIKSKKSGPSWATYFPYSVDELMRHLERQFERGMTWENYGRWHIDHIVPVASFDLELPGEIEACFAITNLRPLWASENRKKQAARTHLI